MRRRRKCGFTLIELVITIVMFVLLATVVIYVFRAVLLTWSSQETRAGIDINIDRAIEEMARDVREATAIDAANDDEIRFTTDDSYIYYFYNESDAYPPGFDQSLYDLKRVTLTGVVGGDLTTGDFTYGNGKIIITDVLPPDASDLSINANLITIDLSIARGDETVRSRTQVRPRNL